MADIAREYLENSLENEYILNTNSDGKTPTPVKINEAESTPTNTSSYVITRNDSQLSRDVDRWLGDTPTEVPQQDIRALNMQRSVLLSRQESILSNSFWYLTALVLPIFNAISYPQLQCSPNAVFNSVGLLIAQFGQMCTRVRCQLRRMTENTHASDLFATAMDIILVVYAVGFLILSMYQATLIG